MLSRLFSATMPPSTKLQRWDVFCTVIDNFGDIGVCWRLALQLANEHGCRVRLWVDDLNAFQRICSAVNPLLEQQHVAGIEIRRWGETFAEIDPGDVVVEAFACRLPELFEAAMARRVPAPFWINLDYLSAEAWVSGCHALPSPHPRLPLTKHFFFPGFDESTGGLLREHDLADRRRSFCKSPDQKAEFWHRLDQTPPASAALLVSLFAYEPPPLPELLEVWANGQTPICCLAPVTRTLTAIEAFAGRRLNAGDIVRQGQLEIRMMPFVSQVEYDRLLWLCDLNFVRGEDSFVRAQWAAKPMIWHIYPQEDDAHRVKLDAFLERYCADLADAPRTILYQFMHAWNAARSDAITPLSNPTSQILAALWTAFLDALPELQKNAATWEKNRSKQEDLCTSLVRFCRSTV